MGCHHTHEVYHVARLTFACGFYDRTEALRTGDVKVKDIDLDFIAIEQPHDLFDRMGASRSSTPPNSPAPNSSAASPAATARSWRYLCFPRACSARLHLRQPQGGHRLAACAEQCAADPGRPASGLIVGPDALT